MLKIRVINRLYLTHLPCSYCFPFPLQNTLTNIFCTLSDWLMLTANIYESDSVMSDFLRPHGLNNPWNYPGQNTGVHSFSLLQGIFPIQALNPGLPHYRQILYHLSHQGSALLQRRCNTAQRGQLSALGCHSYRRRRSCSATGGHCPGPLPQQPAVKEGR